MTSELCTAKKRCTKCGQVKSLLEFYKQCRGRNSKDGHTSACKLCQRQAVNDRRGHKTVVKPVKKVVEDDTPFPYNNRVFVVGKPYGN